MNIPDIDMDFVDGKHVIKILNLTRASELQSDILVPHRSGVYFNKVPVDSKTKLCSLPYDIAEERGYMKVDILSVTMYENVKSEEHLNTLINQEPEWGILEVEELVNTLPHIKNHFDIINIIKPKSIEDLAIVLALIRPGKRKLKDYTMDYIKKNIWLKEEDEKFTFKKSHAIGYAQAIVVKMNLMLEEIQ